VRPDVRRWFERRTYAGSAWHAAELVAVKGGTRVSVVLPALDEAATVGAIVAAIRRDLIDRVPLVDELVVLDSGSTDATADVAAGAGATVVAGGAVLPRLGSRPGKGEALWKSLHVTTGDLVVFLDADLRGFPTTYLTGLLGPLLTEPQVDFVKAAYDRPLRPGSPHGGGRVTELVARPLLNLHWPQLAGFVQPLAGEYAGRRSVLEQVPFVTGYGVELALLVDLLELVGLDALAQVDLGRRVHRNRSNAELGLMASAVTQTALTRLAPVELPAATLLAPRTTSMTQFDRGLDGRYRHTTTDVLVTERPPLASVPEYAVGRAVAS
jgi:glucosyl-3-phosphoglycerate synthase